MLNKDTFSVFDVEQPILGSLIVTEAFFDVVGLSPEEFTQGAHRKIFQALRDMNELGVPVDLFSLSEFIDAHGNLSSIGGIKYLSELAEVATLSEKNAKHYASVLRRKNHERRIAQGGESINVILNGHHTPDEKLQAAEGVLDSLVDKSTSQKALSLIDLLPQTIEDIERNYANAGNPPEFPFGIDDLDNKTCGASRGDLVIVAGRPSMGKTAFAMNNIVETLCQAGKKGLVCSLEMSGKQLVNRMISSVGRIDAQRLRKGEILDEDWNKITIAASRIHQMKLFVDETASASIYNIRASARRAKRSLGGLDFIVIDYMQLMSGSNKKSENRTAEISEISRGLKSLARDFDVPVYALSQLNRGLEQRANKRPVMSDLRESGAIEQDADLILFLYRDEVYNPDSAEKGLAEIIIGKQRNGPIGTCMSAFIGQYARFENLYAGGRDGY